MSTYFRTGHNKGIKVGRLFGLLFFTSYISCAKTDDVVQDKNKKSRNLLYYDSLFDYKSDHGRIQTCNLLIRSQMLYSVELRSRFLNANAKVK